MTIEASSIDRKSGGPGKGKRKIATMNGREALMEILLKEAVEYVFGIPGATEVLFMDALEDHPEIRYILGLHEVVVMGMAKGYARASNKVGFVNLHTGPGLAAAMPMLLNAHLNEPQIDFWQLAQAMGVNGQKVERPEQLREAFNSVLESGRPGLVEVSIESIS